MKKYTIYLFSFLVAWGVNKGNAQMISSGTLMNYLNPQSTNTAVSYSGNMLNVNGVFVPPPSAALPQNSKFRIVYRTPETVNFDVFRYKLEAKWAVTNAYLDFLQNKSAIFKNECLLLLQNKPEYIAAWPFMKTLMINQCIQLKIKNESTQFFWMNKNLTSQQITAYSYLSTKDFVSPLNYKPLNLKFDMKFQIPYPVSLSTITQYYSLGHYGDKHTKNMTIIN